MGCPRPYRVCYRRAITTQGNVEIDGASLFYEEDGGGEPVVLLHGNILDGRMWEPQVEPLSARYRVLRMDVRGYGRSKWHPARYSDHGDVFGLVRSLGLEKAHVVGLSMGGSIALDFALAYPEATRSLIVVPGGVGGHDLPESFERGFEEFVSAARDGDFERAINLVMDFPPMRPAGRIPEVRSTLTSMMNDYTWVNLLEEYGDYEELQPSAWERLEEIPCQTLIVCGELDIEEFREEGEILARKIPRAELVTIPGAGHMVNLEAQAEFNAVVLGFLADVVS